MSQSTHDHFDYWDPALAEDPHPTLHRLREECPVLRSEALGGYWFVSSYDGVREVFSSPEVFSNRHLTIPPVPLVLIPESIDPPEHVAYRQLFAPLFSPAQARAIEPATIETASQLVDGLVRAGGGDFLHGFAVPLPCTVFLRMLGLPVHDLDRLLVWKDAVMRDMISGDEELARHAEQVILPQMMQYFAESMAERRAMSDPPEDILTGMLHSQLALDGGRPLSDDEILNALLLLVLAGLDTVTAILALSVETLARRPDLRRQIVDDPSIIPSAVEELLRYWSLTTNCRQANVDHVLEGVQIAAGDLIAVCTAAASRDPDEFEDPDEIDFRRVRNRHMAFGMGPHRCLGSHLARMELVVALEVIHERMPDYELAPGTTPRHHFGGVMGCDALELRVP